MAGTPEYAEAMDIATQHCLWCARQGLLAIEVILPLYLELLGPHETPVDHIPADPGWPQAVWIVAAAQAQLAQPFTKSPGGTMSRIRSLHPSQWTQEDWVNCSPWARLLLLGLRNQADDRGVFEWRPASLKMQILPNDPVDTAALLDELLAHEQIARFETDGRAYGVCLLWDQKPRRPQYRYPAPPIELRQHIVWDNDDARTDAALVRTIPDNVRTAPDNVRTAPDNVRTAPDIDRGTVTVTVLESESESKRESTPAPAGAALSLNFDLPDEWKEEVRDCRQSVGLAEINLDAEWAKFRNHYAGKRRRDWRRRWLNWGLNALAPPGNRAAPNHQDAVSAAEAGEASAASRDPHRATGWGRGAAWWRKFDPGQQTKARVWVERGTWRGIGGPPGSANCLIDSELAEAAMAERAKRLREQPELLLPHAGGAEPKAVENKPKQGDRDPRTTPPPGQPWPGDSWENKPPVREAG